MFRRMLPAIASLTLQLAATLASAGYTTQKARIAPTLGPVASFERADARELVREAKALWHIAGDDAGALAKFNAAVDADPKDGDVRLQRAHFFEALSEIAAPQDRAKFRARAQSDYETIAEADPDSLAAGMARDGLTRLAGTSVLDDKPVMCPKSAIEIHARADALYGARRYDDAATEYEKAAEGCPDVAAWWVDFADAYYVLEEYERAKELFVRALSVDPWNREAHRFLADTELQLSDLDAAARHLILAVVADPTCEAGWMALRMYASATGRKWNRVFANRKAGLESADGAPWAAYRASKGKARGAREGSASALAIERAAVRSALAAARASATGVADAAGPFWSMMSRAEQAGFLDEAIFIHMLDAALASEYRRFREKDAERLASYLETVVME